MSEVLCKNNQLHMQDHSYRLNRKNNYGFNTVSINEKQLKKIIVAFSICEKYNLSIIYSDRIKKYVSIII